MNLEEAKPKPRQQSRAAFLFGALLLLLFAPTAVLAATAEHAPDFKTLLWPAVNFIIFALLVCYFYRKAGAGVLRKRSVEIKQFLDNARQELARADNQLSSLDQRLSAIDLEKEEMYQRFENEGEKMGERIIQNAHLASERMVEDTKRQIENELNRAKKELRQEAVRISVEKARNRLETEISEEKDRELRKKALAEALF